MASTTSTSAQAPGPSASATNASPAAPEPGAAYNHQMLAVMQAQAIASMMGQNGMMGTNPFMTQNPLNSFAGMNPMLGAMGINFAQFNAGQIVADALKLSSTPVGSMPDDEELLIQALCETEKTGRSYRQALDGLHGKNNHAANVWKDYYLEHHRRINDLVARRCTPKKPASLKRPSFRSPSPSSAGTFSPPVARPSKPLGRKRSDLKKSENASSKEDGFTRQKSCASHQSSTARSPSPERIRIPSREPTPPTEAIPIDPLGKAHRYTTADREYLTKYTRWRIHQDMTLSTDILAEELNAKVPHHSVESWRRRLGQKKDEIDAIYEEARKIAAERENEGESEVDVPEHEEEESASQVHADRSYQPDDDDSDHDDADDEKEADQNDRDDNGSDFEGDVKGMSQFREPWNEADTRVMARYIVSIPDWETLRGRERWEPYAAMYPHRKPNAWQQAYRSHKHDVDQEVEKRRRRKEQESVNTQVAERTETSHGQIDSSPTQPQKRRYSESLSDEDDEDVPLNGGPLKRSRLDEGED